MLELHAPICGTWSAQSRVHFTSALASVPHHFRSLTMAGKQTLRQQVKNERHVKHPRLDLSALRSSPHSRRWPRCAYHRASNISSAKRGRNDVYNSTDSEHKVQAFTFKRDHQLEHNIDCDGDQAQNTAFSGPPHLQKHWPTFDQLLDSDNIARDNKLATAA